MSTRSNIGIQNEDGSVEMVYCHWDGYLSNNGAILRKHYLTESKIRKLIAGGDMSSLEDMPSKIDYYGQRSKWTKYGPAGSEQDEPWEQVKPQKYSHPVDIRYMLKDSCTQYIYIFDSVKDKWRWDYTGNFTTVDKMRLLTKKQVGRDFDEGSLK